MVKLLTTTAAVLAALGILVCGFEGAFKRTSPVASIEKQLMIVAEEDIPPINGRS